MFINGAENRNQPIEHQLTEDALNVCKLLAINPEDIVTRTLDDFYQNNLNTERQKLRFEYYDEKRLLKLKAIENILAKTQ